MRPQPGEVRRVDAFAITESWSASPGPRDNRRWETWDPGPEFLAWNNAVQNVAMNGYDGFFYNASLWGLAV